MEHLLTFANTTPVYLNILSNLFCNLTPLPWFQIGINHYVIRMVFEIRFVLERNYFCLVFGDNLRKHLEYK